MLVQVEMLKSKSGDFKLIVRTETENGMNLLHQRVLELDADLLTSAAMLFKATAVDFEELSVVASDKLLNEMKERQAVEEAAKAQLQSQPAVEVAEGEVVA